MAGWQSVPPRPFWDFQAALGSRWTATDTRAKHDSVALREAQGRWRAGKRRQMGLPALDFEPVRCGLTYSLRLGGTWVAADWWLQYFAVDEHTKALRLEHLTDDLNTHVLPLLPVGTTPFQQLPRENARPGAALARFSSDDLQRIAAVNPRWTAWERHIYGENSSNGSPA